MYPDCLHIFITIIICVSWLLCVNIYFFQLYHGCQDQEETFFEDHIDIVGGV